MGAAWLHDDRLHALPVMAHAGASCASSQLAIHVTITALPSAPEDPKHTARHDLMCPPTAPLCAAARAD